MAFSLVARSQGGWAKCTATSVASEKAVWVAIRCPGPKSGSVTVSISALQVKVTSRRPASSAMGTAWREVSSTRVAIWDLPPLPMRVWSPSGEPDLP